MARIELNGISHCYGSGDDAFAIESLELSWEDGSANALLGPSGCGKTTVLNVISGLLHPDDGRVLFDGRDVTNLDARGRHIAQVFQFPVVYETMNVYDNLAFPLRNQKRPAREVDRRVREVAELLELTDWLRSPARALGAAEKQIVSLGRGIVREDTAAVLLDEPLTVIDPKQKWHLRRKLREVQRSTGLTMIYVTHDQHEALTFADAVTVMYNGSVVQTGAPQELHDAPATPFVGYFIGSPGMNLISAEIRDGKVWGSGFALPIPDGSGADVGAACTLGIRPEHIGLADAATESTVDAVVTAVENVGAYRIVRAAVGESAFRFRGPENGHLNPGDAVHCVFPPEYIRLYPAGETVPA